MSVVLTIAGKKYTITSSSVDADLLEEAARLFDEAAVEVSKKEPLLSEGQLCAIVAMRCLVPLLMEKRLAETTIESSVLALTEALNA